MWGGGGGIVHLDDQAHVVTSTSSSSSCPPPSVPRFLGVALIDRLELPLRFVWVIILTNVAYSAEFFDCKGKEREVISVAEKIQEGHTISANLDSRVFFFALWGYIIVRPKEKGESDSNPSIQPANRPEEQSRGQNKCALARARPQWLLLCFTLPNRTISARSPVQGRLVSQ